MIIKVVMESDISSELDKKIKSGLCSSFPESSEFFKNSKYWNGVQPEFSIIGVEEDEVIAHMGIVQREIKIGGSVRLTIFGLQNVFILSEYRGKRILDSIMEKAFDEAKAREFDFGLLFCLPALEKVYARYSWVTIQDSVVFEVDEQGNTVLKEKNGICMYYPVKITSFPQGDINLLGRSW